MREDQDDPEHQAPADNWLLDFARYLHTGWAGRGPPPTLDPEIEALTLELFGQLTDFLEALAVVKRRRVS